MTTRTVTFRHEATGRVAAAAVAGVWALLVGAQLAGRLPGRAGAAAVDGLPLLLAAALVLRRRPVASPLAWAAGGMVLVADGTLLTQLVLPHPKLVLGLAAALAASAVTARRPAGALLATLAVSGTYGSLTAFTPLPPAKLAELLLAALWIGVAARIVSGSRTRPLRIAPGLAALVAFSAIELLQVAGAPSLTAGVHTFTSTGFYVLAAALVPALDLDDARLRRIATGIASIAVAVAGYAVLRKAIGASHREFVQALQQPFTFRDGKLLLIGSFLTNHQLAAWCGLLIPACAGLATQARGTARIAALAAIPLSVLALLGTEVRGGLAGAVAGLALVLVLYHLARAFPGPRLGPILLAVAAVAVGGAFAIAGSSGGSTQRYTAIASPGRDAAYQARQRKWDETLRAVRAQPLGHGLGSANSIQVQQGRFDTIGSYSIDNSYLRIAYEQGVVPLLLFVLGLVVLLGGLVHRAATAADPLHAGLAIAAAGALASYAVMLWPGNLFDGYTALTLWLLAGAGLAPFARDRPPA
jgi:O-antigen ligase